MTAAPRFSIVVTAPHGIAHCLFIDQWHPELATHSAELIIADATEGPSDRDAGPIRHLRFPGATLQQLMADGAGKARGDWVLVTEDHCRPLGGVLTAYARAIAEAPEADLIAGVVDNLTSDSPWSWVIFAIGLGEFWRAAPRPPRSGTNANFLVRRSAIRKEELLARGGLLNGTLPRLVAEGRFATCSGAAVDHVVHVDRRNVIDFEYRVTREARAEARSFAGQTPSLLAGSWISFRRFMGLVLLAPCRTWQTTRNTPLDKLSHHLRVAYVCAGVATRLARDDLSRLRQRRAPRSKR